MKLTIFILSLFSSLCVLLARVSAATSPECGRQAHGALCPDNLCCSSYGFCGTTAPYCGARCQSQCRSSPPPSPPAPSPPPPSPPPPSPPPPSPPPPSPPPPSPPPPSPPPPSPPPPSPPPPSPPPPPANPERPDHKCGPDFNNNPCNPGRCCSTHNYCGTTAFHCQRPNCRYQCRNSATTLADLPHALLRDSHNVNDLRNIIIEPLFNEMFKHRKDCPSQDFYNYASFIIAATSFPGFGTTGNVATRKRELAGFFAYTSQATATGEWTDSSDPHTWGYCFINRTTSEDDYCTSSHWSCASGKKYNGRGPFQLTHNYNYGLASGALGVDLINNPDLVATDSVVSFQTAIWYWMTQHDDKPSFHNILVNADSRLRQLTTYMNRNDGLLGTPTNVVGYYKRYCDILQISYGDILEYQYDHATFFPKTSTI